MSFALKPFTNGGMSSAIILVIQFCYDITKSDLSLDKIKYRVGLIGHE